jgi:hypothetical protein
VTAVAELVSVGPALRAAVDRLEPSTWAIAAYHFGWVDAAGRPSGSDVTGGGKGVRARLALLSARAAGAPAEVGLPGAVAVELLHNFSLVHDDVMDGDLQRRHRRTVWASSACRRRSSPAARCSRWRSRWCSTRRRRPARRPPTCSGAPPGR